MSWKIKDLEDKLSTLKSKRNLSEEDKLNINNLIDMINYHYHKDVFTNMEYIERIYEKERTRSTINFIKRVLPDITLSVSYIGNIHDLPVPFFKSKKIDIDEYITSIANFFALYNPDIYIMFIKYLEESKIELKPYTYKQGTLGRCYNFNIDEPTCYISARYKNNFKISSTLVHELGHAFTFDKINDSVKSQNVRTSVFVESIPIYYELLYSDYLKMLGNQKEALYIKNSIYNNFICILDCCSQELINMSFKGPNIPQYVRRFLGDLLAFKLYYLTLIDKELGTKLIYDLNNMLGLNTDEEIFKYFNLEDNKHLEDLLSNYRKDFKKSKNKII